MKLSVADSSSFAERIDREYGTEASIACRYRNAVRWDDPAGRDPEFRRHILESSIREGERVVSLLTYRGVAVHILDETSRMATGSLKSIDGCLTTALCRMEGIDRIAFESGGNTGNALTRYGQNAGLETFFFCPRENVDLVDDSLFDGPGAHLIAVQGRGRVKELTGLFARATGIRQVPDKAWRYAAGMFRGLFLLEHMQTAGGFDWISQTISAAFGPIGIYKVLSAFRDEAMGLPRFLGVQQESNCPMVRAWNPGIAKRLGNPVQEQGRLLTRVMYDDSPGTHDTYRDLERLLLLTGGDLLTINAEEFESTLRPSAECGPILDLLRSRGIAIRMRSGEVQDKTGLIALAGTLKAIDAGVIRAGASVLCALTGGMAAADGGARPEVTVRGTQDVLDYADKVREGR